MGIACFASPVEVHGRFGRGRILYLVGLLTIPDAAASRSPKGRKDRALFQHGQGQLFGALTGSHQQPFEQN